MDSCTLPVIPWAANNGKFPSQTEQSPLTENFFEKTFIHDKANFLQLGGGGGGGSPFVKGGKISAKSALSLDCINSLCYGFSHSL